MLALLAAVALTGIDPYQLFARAHTYWANQNYPPLLEYRVAVDVTEGGKERVEHYASSYDAVSSTVGIDPVSDWEEAHPASGAGINVSFFGLALNKPQAPEDFLGVPLLAPAYTFGMGPIPRAIDEHALTDAQLVAQVRAQFHDPNPRKVQALAPEPQATPIATVVASRHDYTITLVGEDAVDGHECYHLRLQPTHDPGRNRLRDLWLDGRGAPWKLTEALNFVDGAGTGVPWTVYFQDVGGAHYVASEDADAPIDTSGLVFENTSVRFEAIRAVSQLDFQPVAPQFLPTNLLREP